jgi:hypothetical protein
MIAEKIAGMINEDSGFSIQSIPSSQTSKNTRTKSPPVAILFEVLG